MRRLAASCFGLGRLPLAPGTWGSLPPAIIFVLMGRLDAPALTVSVVMAALAVLGSVISIGCAPVVIAVTGKTDPREVVADEFAGQSLAFAIVGSVSLGHIWAAAALGFLLFRFLDILKPWPIRNLEKLPAGWGVLADDLMAGLYAGIVLLFCLRIGLVLYISESFRSDNGSLNVFHAAMLGAIQGLTEFLPVSSSGHLVLFETLFDFNPEEPRMLLFDLAAHAGTVAAIFIVFHRSIAAFFKNLIRSGEYGAGAVEIYKRNPSAHLLVLAVFATIVTGIGGVLFSEYFAAARGNLGIVASMWVVTGTLLLITDLRKRTRLGLRQFTVWQAALVGVSQAAAIIPGISRSGATICAAILMGLRRRWAVEFSFLIAIPAILGATAIKLVQDFEKIGSRDLPLASVIIGSAVATIVGIMALKLLIKAARGTSLKFFAFYCYILAFCVWLYLLK